MWPFWYGWWFPFHGLFSLLVLVILILVLNSALRGHRYARYGRTAALDVLEQRYARGEIQREEYLQKKHDLGG
jgi:putative membrane protein